MPRIKRFIGKNIYANWKLKRCLVRFIIIVLICALALGIPRFALLLNILGAISGTSLQFVFPVILYNKYFMIDINSFGRIRNYIILVVGGLAGTVSLIYSFVDLFKGGSD